MKRVKVFVPVHLIIKDSVDGDEIVELEMINDSASDELDIIETDAINAYESGDYQELTQL